MKFKALDTNFRLLKTSWRGILSFKERYIIIKQHIIRYAVLIIYVLGGPDTGRSADDGGQ